MHGNGIVQILEDLDDYGDGLRVHGNTAGWGDGSELAEESWEIGGTFYKNWYWAIDSKVIELSNRKRRERGLGPLRIKG
jgi:hypothetical protein